MVCCIPTFCSRAEHDPLRLLGQPLRRNRHGAGAGTGGLYFNRTIGKLGYDNMGRLLDDELGDNYYAIGTDFYKTKCNLPNGSSGHRTNQVFYSYDPLAKAAMQAKLDICWLDFSYASKSPELSKWISDYHYMGSLGEGYAFWMRLLPPSYRKFQQPDEIYDSMIFVAEATPTVILNTQSD